MKEKYELERLFCLNWRVGLGLPEKGESIKIHSGTKGLCVGRRGQCVGDVGAKGIWIEKRIPKDLQ